MSETQWTPNDCARDPVGAALVIEQRTYERDASVEAAVRQGEGYRKEIARLQSIVDNAVVLSAKYERLRTELERLASGEPTRRELLYPCPFYQTPPPVMKPRSDGISKLVGKIEHLEFALRGLYWDQVDYLKRNNLSGMDNHWMRAARIALGIDPEQASELS